jgi:hypothetical protein
MNIITDEEFEEAFNQLGSDFGFEKKIKSSSNYFRKYRYESIHTSKIIHKNNYSINLVYHRVVT